MTTSFKKYFEGAIKERESGLWLEIAKKRTETVKALLEYFSSRKFIFEPDQLSEIYKGLNSGLSEEEILIYANPKFSVIKMSIIREGLENKTGIKIAKIFANSNLNYLQMLSVLEWIEKGVKLEEMMPYIDSKYNYKKLDVIFRALLGQIECMELIVDPNYDCYYMDVIRKAILKYDDYAIKYIKKYSKKNFSPEQLECILYYACEIPKEFTDRQIDFIANPIFDEQQMELVALGFRHGLTFEHIRIYTEFKLDYAQMAQVDEAFINKRLSIEQVKPYISFNFNAKQLECIFSGIANGYDVNLYANKWYKAEQMQVIMEAIKNELSEEKLNILLDSNLITKNMNLILKAFESGVEVEEIKLIWDSNFNEQKVWELIKKHNKAKIDNDLKQLREILF